MSPMTPSDTIPKMHGVVAEQTEQGARVLAEDEADEVADDAHRSRRATAGRDQPRLRQLVEDPRRSRRSRRTRPSAHRSGASRRPCRAAGAPPVAVQRGHRADARGRDGGRSRPGRHRARRSPASASGGGVAVGERRPACRRRPRGRCGRDRRGDARRSTGRSGRPARGRPRGAGPGSPRASSRASPSARSSGVSAVSRTTTRPSRSATAVPGRGRGLDLDLVRREGDAAERHRPVVLEA